jgi:putative ABC transport system permease protein
MRPSLPPRLAVRLLQWRLPPDAREFFLGDLEESFHDQRRNRGDTPARRWYWGQALLALVTRWGADHAARPAKHEGDGPMGSLLLDLRAALRVVGRQPTFAGLVILTFALGIGAATAIFSAVNPVLLQDPPYPDADRLALVFERDKDGSESHTGYLTFLDLQRETHSLASAAAVSFWQPVLDGQESEVLPGQRVTSGFFATLGVQPALGRDFVPEEDHDGAAHVVILGHGLWQRRFGGDSAIVGRTVSLGGTGYSVIGVLPATFESLLSPSAQVWSPLRYETSQSWACRTCRHLRMVARLKAGVTRAQALDELQQVSRAIVAAHPTDYPAPGILLIPLHDYLTRRTRPLFFAVSGAVALLLLIACTNGVNLFMGRAIDRTREFAVRAALGAGRVSLVRRLIAEALVLALLGGLLGVVVALYGVRLLVQFAPATLPRLGQIRVDGAVLGFTFLVTVVAGVGAGLVPALAVGRANLAGLIRQGARPVIQGGGSSVRRVLVVSGVALALILLTGAGLLMRSLDRLLAVDPGFETRGLLTMELQASGDDDAAVRRYYTDLLGAVRGVPGVTKASLVNQLPLSGDFDSWGVHFEARPTPNPADAPSAFRFAVGPGFLATMGIPLLAGRDFSGQDAETTPPVALISQGFASSVLGKEDPVGQRIKIGGPEGPWRTIVGVVGDVHHQGLDIAGEWQIYLPSSQTPWAHSRMALLVRGAGERPAALLPAIRQAIHRVDPGVPISHPAMMSDLVQATTAQRRFALVVFECFAGVALLLAGGGLYGVIAASVSQRGREIGIRSALGASAAGILALVLRQGMGLALAGMLIGLGGAVALSRLLTALLYGVSPTDPGTFLLVGLMLVAVALLACWLPARRALRVDPLEALREE